MHITFFQMYLIAINIIAFLIYTIDFQIYIHGGDGIKPPVLCNLVTTFGGALGTLVAEILWDRKLNKQNLRSRIYTIVWLFIQLTIVVALYGPNNEKVKSNIMAFYSDNRWLCLYLLAINLITFIVYGIDKYKALRHKWRIREVLLLGLALIGGSVGAILAMDFFDHKTGTAHPHYHFLIGVPLIIILHLFLLVSKMLGVL